MVSNISSGPGGTLLFEYPKAGFHPATPKPSTLVKPHHHSGRVPKGFKSLNTREPCARALPRLERRGLPSLNIIVEAPPTHYIAGVKGDIVVKPRGRDDVELARLMASKLGLEVAIEGDYIRLKPGG
jgi:hypothetical protein